MDYASFYREYLADCERMGYDEVCASPSSGGEGWHNYTDQQLIAIATQRKLGVGDIGHELEARGLLNKIPGNDWGYARP